MFRTVLFALVIILLSVGIPWDGGAQEPAQESQEKQAPARDRQDTVRIGTQLVQVDVVVTDKKGRHVEDLAQEELELFLDGKKQPLSHFKHISLPGAITRELPKKKKGGDAVLPESMPTRQIDPSEVRRTIAFIVDDLGLGFTSTERVRETLRKFVAEQMRDGDLVAIIRTGNGLGLLEQFTSDKRILYSAIEKLAWNPLSRDMNPTFGDGSAELTEDQTERQAMLDSFEQFRTTNFTRGTLGSIGFVVQGLRSLPGRKSVILLSDGFQVYTQDGQNVDPSTTELLLQAMRGLVESAGRAGVVVYAMDAKGLQAYMPGPETGGRPSAQSYSDTQDAAQAALEGPVFLAKETGGFLVTNSNDLNVGIQEALYDQQSYYLVGFDPDDETFDRKFHKISIRSTRPGLTIRTRSGFFGESEGEGASDSGRPMTRGEQHLAALMSPIVKRDLSLRMTPYFFNSAKEGPMVRTLFHIDPARLAFRDGPEGKKVLSLELAAFAFDETGSAADLTAHRINLSFTEEQVRQLMAHGLAYRRDFPLKKPGAYQFRAVIRDSESGATGSASQFIRVPDLSQDRLSISGLVLTAPKAGGLSGGEAPSPALLSASPYVRLFARTGEIQYGAAIYNGASDKKTGRIEITAQAEVYRDGKRVYQFPAKAVQPAAGANPRRFDYVGMLRLNDFPPGEYVLHLIVSDALAKKRYGRVDQWMDFRVE
ncbi:MAG: VWA domain-containing protein [Blastocatellia bacterium]